MLCAGEGDLSNIKPLVTVFNEEDEEMEEEDNNEEQKADFLSKK